jgi:hypothetical protein
LYSLSIDNQDSLGRASEEVDLDNEVNLYKRRLTAALRSANYNLLNPKVLMISRELDKLLTRYLQA